MAGARTYYIRWKDGKMIKMISYPKETLRRAQYLERDPQSRPVGMVEASDALRGMGDV